MSTQKSKKKGWPQIGSIRVSDKDPANKFTYIKLQEGVTLLVDGQEVPLNKYRTLKCERPTDVVQRLYDKGIIDESTFDKRMEQLSEFAGLKYEIVAAPPKED